MPSSMAQSQTKSINAQARLLNTLMQRLRASFPSHEVRLIETHISWVLLAGNFAYKIKKAIKLDFLDFTDLDSRRFYCEEEIRLNLRLAPRIYINVVPIGGAIDAPEIGAMPAVEWAVRMARFDARDEMDRRLQRGELSAVHVDGLATLLARFHQDLHPCPQDAPYGRPDSICHAAMENLKELQDLLDSEADMAIFDGLPSATAKECAARQQYFERRRAEGCMRECHGDLHLANIVLIDGEAVPFDGIEFDPALRWIDVMNDLAFPYMDLIRYGRMDMACRLLTRYLEETGDYGGVEALPFYASGRAAVRAKVHALRASQPSATPGERQAALAACHAYLDIAARLLRPRRPGLIVTCGLPGSGKSTFALAAVERLGAIRIRSDVERKRLFGLKPLEASQGDIYGADAGVRTYEALHGIAGKLLDAGCTVIVDAAFLKRTERERFSQLAHEMNVPFVVAFLKSPEAVLQRRISMRMLQGDDASEAGLAVLSLLQGVAELPQSAEMARTVEFENDGEQGFSSDDPGWIRLERLLGRTGEDYFY